MSGPKVVRVVTREELVAASEALLRRLDAAFAEWQKRAAAAGSDQRAFETFNARRDALEAMLRADKFDQFGTAAVQEIDFLESDADKRLERAAHEKAQESVRLQSGRELARIILKQVGPSSPSAPELARAAAGNLGLAELDAVLARARQALYQPTDIKASAAQKELAARLAGGEAAEDFEAWRARAAAVSPRIAPLLSHVAELELLGMAARAGELHQEVLTASAIEDEAMRGMRLDSLLNTLRAARQEALAVAKLRREANLLAAEAAQTVGAADVVSALAAASQNPASQLQAAIEQARKELAELRIANAAAARRRAVLEGLQQLGYQVHEELSTATAAGGRLVMRDAASSDYAVEIASGAAMDRLQVRTVALNVARNPAGDVPAEQRWCEDFGALKDRLQSQGARVVVEKALGVGAAPIKVLAKAATQEERRGAGAPKPAVRRL